MQSSGVSTQIGHALFQRGEGWARALPSALDSPQTLVVAFGAPALADEAGVFEDLQRAFPRSCIVGCSTSGEIAGPTLHDGGMSVGVIRFASARVRGVFAPVRGQADSFHAGDALARSLEGADLRGVLVFSDGLNVNGSELVRGLNAVIPENIPMTGGLAGDGTAFKRTWIIKDGKPVTGAVCAIGLYGERVRVGHGSVGGWDPFGPLRTVTRSSGNVLYELDGKPALGLYKQYLGDLAAQLPASALRFPLSMRASAEDEKVLVRTILSVDEGAQSMTFAGDLPTGSIVQLMRANFDRLVQASGDSSLAAQMGTEPNLTILVSCVGRRLVLGERTEEELEAAMEHVPEGGACVGFYSYGELSPAAGGRCDLHNQTMTITTISET